MNNSFIALQNVEEVELPVALPGQRKYQLTRAKELGEIVDALQAIKRSNHWKVLERVWEEVTVSLQGRLKTEKEPHEIYRLQGQLGWADKYFHLDSLTELFQKELQSITNQLNGKTNSSDIQGSDN